MREMDDEDRAAYREAEARLPLLTTAAEMLDNMGDPNHYMRHSRTELRVSRLPRVPPPAEGKGRCKGTRAQRRARP